MSDEQKPESAEFRTREACIADLAICMTRDNSGFHRKTVEYVATSFIDEAEARGAANQRQKDAEGACGLDPAIIAAAMGITDAQKTLPEWVHLNPETGARSLGRWAKGITGEHALYVRADLTLRPANVAALEARVKELEGEVERLKKPEFYSVEDQETGWCDLESLMESLDGDVPYFEPVEIDCFRSVPKIWAFYDGNTVHEFATEDEARTASAAAIREGGEHG